MKCLLVSLCNFIKLLIFFPSSCESVILCCSEHSKYGIFVTTLYINVFANKSQLSFYLQFALTAHQYKRKWFIKILLSGDWMTPGIDW